MKRNGTKCLVKRDEVEAFLENRDWQGRNRDLHLAKAVSKGMRVPLAHVKEAMGLNVHDDEEVLVGQG